MFTPGRSRPLLSALLSLVVLAIWAMPTRAEDRYPNRPITLVVPFAAGGPSDTIARIIALPMAQELGQPVTIENISGAGGSAGITRASQAKPDGYTIMLGHMGTHGTAPVLFRNLKYDPARSFDPIGLAVKTPIVLVARKQLPAEDLKAFVEYVLSDPLAVNQAHAGLGSVSYATGRLFNSIIHAHPTMVVYRGTGPAMSDLISGQVDFMTDQIVNVVPHVRAGAIRAYAIAAPERSPALPNVPTMREAGLPAFEVSAWTAMFAPKGVRPEIHRKLVEALAHALENETARATLTDLGAQIPPPAERGPAALQKLVEEEVARWAPILHAGANGE